MSEKTRICPTCNSETDWMPHDDLWNEPPQFKGGDFCYVCEKNVTPIEIDVPEPKVKTTHDLEDALAEYFLGGEFEFEKHLSDLIKPISEPFLVTGQLCQWCEKHPATWSFDNMMKGQTDDLICKECWLDFLVGGILA